MDLSLLDNAGWYALNSHHQHLAIKGKAAVRYQPDVFFGAAVLENTRTAYWFSQRWPVGGDGWRKDAPDGFL